MRPNQLFALAMLCACSGDLDGEPTPVVGVGTRPPTGQVPGDRDGDGLPSSIEEVGYTIRVNTDGRPGLAETRVVVTDPAVADTDGDGLDDATERALGTDGSLADSDGDGLSDFDEVHRWGTSPVHVDTDGDSTGGDVGTTAPLRDLFDGAELALDDSGMPGPGATSPIFSDTDGDGLSDHTESLSPSRSPVLADRPEARVSLAQGTGIEMVLNIRYGEGLTSSTAVNLTTASTDIASNTTSSTASAEASAYLEVAMGINANVTVGATYDSLGVDASAELWGEVIAGSTFATTMAIGYAHEHRNDRTRAFSETLSDLETSTYTFDSGSIDMALEVTNTGSLTFTFTDLAVGLKTLSPGSNTLRPLGTLTVADDVANTLAPGESTTVVVSNDAINPGRMLELFGATTLQVGAPTLNLVNEDSNDFDFELEQVLARTTAIEIDRGDGEVSRHYLATDIARDADGALVRPRLRDVLDTLGVQNASDDTHDPTIYTIDGIPTRVYSGGSTDFTGLDPLGYPLTGGPPQPFYLDAWHVFVRRSSPFNEPLPLNVLDAEVGPGDRVMFTFSSDEDGDGLLGAEEQLHGASDQLLDSDGDGLSDYWELREGVVVTTDQVSFLSYSSPSAIDTDGDGLDDLEEVALGLSPVDVDTDGDGYSDSFEVADDQPGLDPLAFDFITVPVVYCDTGPFKAGVIWEDAEGDVVTFTIDMDLRADVTTVCPGAGPVTYQNQRASWRMSHDPPLVSRWVTATDGYPLRGAPFYTESLNGDPVPHDQLLRQLVDTNSGTTWLAALNQPVTIDNCCGTASCDATLSDIEIVYRAYVFDLQSNTSQIDCVLGAQP